ncbi:tyrosine-protein phosphatase [Vibrio natriegens]|uniref:Tyrosine specific protein phosphatases domain-containing protein n=1 Tax=Vibrio natriegens NBRC 15636 = ATCC 14048 = DSM 759 TaxID=1219067 RepID=A0AAN1CXT2_VIBNA|nr:tyrosine-protein phosphatase [Vibrio natriegens]ALR18128.1 hypothetical protein PN96_19505 [Vibrio natriegens NBRC 15636 = ATCC 14048 = DSM 759]ANQ14075.1 hypothetical protein BA890_15010 [Vibrio natriegens NBRC 15636 = ATCC 14048 = DSM 759]EPM41610.1 hypothetical protein M272_08555 [Vibrio natriegens NBRC 15636 = ATCC 14048 = DSM 759]MDX6028994.1 tyrosine-protein phosphatase [Vibrio natriegens NBRC 15636 = ATCC 14048 = DSM 759]UUI14295.1 tyrosine-protein phosphatase [Vibrio natriegens]
MNIKTTFKLVSISAMIAMLTACNGETGTTQTDVAAASATYSDEHHVVLTGEDNFRDLGGYVGADNKRVASGKLFRSGELSALTDEDRQKLEALGLVRIFDLRRPSEAASNPDAISQEIEYTNFSLINELPSDLTDTDEDEKEDLTDPKVLAKYAQIAIDFNYDLSSWIYPSYEPSEHMISQWRAIFDLLEDSDTPALWHCTAGQDRTGMTAALILYSLGVSMDDIFSDYLMSNEYTYADKYAQSESILPYLPELDVDAYTESMLVKRGYLEHFFTDIETKYGSIDEFLSNELDVDIDAMREHYLVGEGLPSSVVYTDEHHIELIGEDNFRDLGGYVGADNKRVLEGKLFRSGELSGLTEGDKQILTDLGIEQLVDLRTKGEMLDKPDNIPDTIDVYHLPLVPEAENDNSSAVQVNLVDQWVNNLRDPNFDNEAEMISAYNYIDEQRIANWTEIFDLLESNKTTLWHCTGGQDRVGMTTALVLSSLGVSRDVIIKDYLATNEYLAEYGEQMARYMATMYNDETLYQTILDNMGARETYINAFFDVVESEYGDMDTFLQVLGVDIELMQQNYLIK